LLIYIDIRKLSHHLVTLSDEHALGAMLGAYVMILSEVRYRGTVGKSSYLYMNNMPVVYKQAINRK